MALLELKGVGKSYGDMAVLNDVNLCVEEGEFVAIVGFSGSGKTTLISLMAGLLAPDAGEIAVRGKKVDGAGPDRGVVFQSYSLMPWLTVSANIALAVDAVFKTASRADRTARVTRYIDMVGLSHAADRRPSELSGGMRQRVAVARARATNPAILLLDEPLSALDALTRAKLQDEFDGIRAQEGKTIVLITNDVDEAILLADRIIPLKPGPRATLGPSFRVTIPRPRQRLALNEDPTFKGLRAEITKYLMDLGASQQAATEERHLPDVQSVTQLEPLPEAVRKAGRSAIVERYVEFFDVRKVYPTPKGPLTVVEKFQLLMKKGEFVSLIGHSGCGKSTVLSMTAGLTEISGGGIVLNAREIDGAGPDRAVVFQAPSLMPWLTGARSSNITWRGSAAPTPCTRWRRTCPTA